MATLMSGGGTRPTIGVASTAVSNGTVCCVCQVTFTVALRINGGSMSNADGANRIGTRREFAGSRSTPLS